MAWSEIANPEEYFKLFAGLLAMSNVIGHLPFFLAATSKLSREDTGKAALAASLAFGVLLLAIVVLGHEVLDLFDLSIAAFQTAGGALIFLNGLGMVREQRTGDAATGYSISNAFSFGLTPLGVPLLAGPGVVSYVLIASTVHTDLAHTLVVGISVLAVTVAIYLVLRTASLLSSYLSDSVRLLLQKIMGLIILTIGIEYLFHGIANHFGLVEGGH